MLGFKKFLTESKEGKNLHLEHIEDEVLNNGVQGTKGAINFLKSLRDMLAGHSAGSVDVTVKWDGAPSIFCGINPENKKFFVGTKGVFAKNAKLNYTNEDIDKNHPSEGLNKKLKIALRYLPEIGITGVLQGDLLFTQGDIQKKEIEGTEYITFQPNTIVYAIPAKSNLAQIVLSAKLGVVFHTSYHGSTMESMNAEFGATVSGLRPTKDVWFRDATFTDATGVANFTSSETKLMDGLIAHCTELFKKINPAVLNRIATNETIKVQIKTYNNSKVREGQSFSDTTTHAIGLVHWVTEKANKEILAAKKADTKHKREMEKKELLSFYQPNLNQLKMVFELQNQIAKAKEMIVSKLKRVQDIGTFLRTDDGFKVTAPEGFVAIDKVKGNAVKLVDRLEFSHANFTAAKNWSK